ncbi:hypothetical protein D3C84_94360 [compost metagenome]
MTRMIEEKSSCATWPKEAGSSRAATSVDIYVGDGIRPLPPIESEEDARRSQQWEIVICEG